MVVIRSLDGTSLSELHAAREAAFAGYVVSWTPGAYERLLQRRGFVSRLSFGAFEDERLVSFTLNGVGTFNGISTVYDCGTGTHPDYQGKGLAGEIFRYSLPILTRQGIGQYLLEALTNNKPAVNLYQRLGFNVVRTFNCFLEDVGQLQLERKRADENLVLQPLVLRSDVIATLSKMWDFQPSWQNSFDAILRKPEDFICLSAYREGMLCGYGIIEPASGDIPQIAVRPDVRRQGIGSQLLATLMEQNRHTSAKVINADDRCTSITSFLLRSGYAISVQQYEMIRGLSE
jgi:ribosomal protein S18 acetylase RimI-like enzyme